MSWNDLVSPVTGERLQHRDDGLVADDGVVYPIRDGIADIVDECLVDKTFRDEESTFENLPIENVCYFRPILFERVLGLILPLLAKQAIPPVAAEIGGGEGYFASAFLDSVKGSTAYVCDLSRKYLTNADPRLRRIRCDARYPYLATASLGLAAFWVSLHHFHGEDRQSALRIAVDTLCPGGLLLVFEPNIDFFPRRMMPPVVKRYIYFEHEETFLNHAIVAELANHFGLEPVTARAVNPPYSLGFLRHYALWPVFLTATELLYRMDALFRREVFLPVSVSSHEGKMQRPSLPWGSYFLSIFQKPEA